MSEPTDWTLATRHLGRRVLIFDSLDSTNSHAAGLAHDPANDGLVIIARDQTGGRGQYGRVWQCPAGEGVLLSVLLFPPASLRRPALLTAWAAVSVCETIEEVSDLPTRIKWPNDVLVRVNKVCGILVEQNRGTVAGIGLNVNQSAHSFAGAGLTVAGSLASLTGRTFDCLDVARRLILRLDDQYRRIIDGDLSTLETRWQQRIGLVGKKVHVECLDGARVGQLRDCTFARLDIEMADGSMVRLSPESVRQLTAHHSD